MLNVSGSCVDYGSYESENSRLMSWMMREDFPTPPAPNTTSLNSRLGSVGTVVIRRLKNVKDCKG